VQKSLVVNGYLKPNEIQKVMWNDTKHDILLRILPKKKALTIKRLSHLSQRKIIFGSPWL
jgi:hypothetical protein